MHLHMQKMALAMLLSTSSVALPSHDDEFSLPRPKVRRGPPPPKPVNQERIDSAQAKRDRKNALRLQRKQS